MLPSLLSVCLSFCLNQGWRDEEKEEREEDEQTEQSSCLYSSVSVSLSSDLLSPPPTPSVDMKKKLNAQIHHDVSIKITVKKIILLNYKNTKLFHTACPSVGGVFVNL